MSDWFTANPASATGTVVICTIADIYAVGAGNAAKAAGRVGSVFASGVAGSADAVALIKAGDPVLVGSVDFRFQDWGKILVPLMLDSMEGLVVPRLSAPNVSMISAKTL
jgi:ABC-type sugar transport system substrate-binding protein